MGRVRGIVEAKSYTLPQLTPSWETLNPVLTSWNGDVAARKGYQSLSWVYACIEKRASAASSVPLKIYAKEDPNGAAITDHPLNALIQNPNPAMSFRMIHDLITCHLDTSGNAILNAIRAGRKNTIQELWPIPPDRIKPVKDRVKFVSHYEYEYGSIRRNIAAEEVLHFRYMDPSNYYWGISPMIAGAKVVDMEIQAIDWNKASMANRAQPDGMISLSGDITSKELDAAEKFLIKQIIAQKVAHRPVIMPSGAKYDRFSFSPAEMDFIESRKFSRDEICTLFGVPPPLVGIYDQATLSNIKTAREIFWLDTIAPYLAKLEDVWNMAFQTDYPDIIAKYDLGNIDAVQGMLKDKILAAKSLHEMGVPFSTINTRLGLGFKPFEGWEVGYTPASRQPVGQDSSNVGNTGNEEAF